MKVGLIGYGELGIQFEHLIAQATPQTEFVYFDDLACAAGAKNAFPFSDYGKDEFRNLKFLVALGYKHLPLKVQIMDSLAQNGRVQLTFVHPSVYVDTTSVIGEGSVIYPGVVIDKNVNIGKGVVLNLSVTIAHDSQVGDASFLAPAAVLCGFSKVGKRCFVGANATLIEEVTVADDIILGAASIVLNNLTERGTYAGVPVKRIS